MVTANMKFSKESVPGIGPGRDMKVAPLQKAADAIKKTVEKFDPHTTVKIGPDTLKVSASHSLVGIKKYEKWSAGWGNGVLKAVNNCLSAQELAGAIIENAVGEVKHGPGIGVPMGDRAYYNVSFTVKLPV
ncbi:MAG: hypothetical protein NTV88_04185 [Candidatus Micrarchaeota archaeon]|nr:hypothetical protein [Candidatus Micrarchaeota archaeon]